MTETLNRWALGECAKAVAEVTAGIEAYRFNEAAVAAYRFVWNVFCDWYSNSPSPCCRARTARQKDETRATIACVLDEICKLLHPFMPFLTEELWAIKGEEGAPRASVLALAPWPHLDGLVDEAAEAEIGWVVDLVAEIRSARSETNVPAGAQIPLVARRALRPTTQARAERWGDTIRRLARLSEIAFADAAPRSSVQLIVRGEVGGAAARRHRRSRRRAGAPRKGAAASSTARSRKIDAKLGNADFLRARPGGGRGGAARAPRGGGGAQGEDRGGACAARSTS